MKRKNNGCANSCAQGLLYKEKANERKGTLSTQQRISLKSYIPVRLKARLASLMGRDRYAELRERLQGIVVEARNYMHEKPTRPLLRVLWGPSFNLEYYSIIHNTLLSSALELRGAVITPLICGAAQYKECTVLGGDYAPYGVYGLLRRNQCEFCTSRDEELWARICGKEPHYLDGFLVQDALNRALSLASAIPKDHVFEFEYEGFPLGQMAKDAVLNSYLAGTLEACPNAYESGRNNIVSEILLVEGYRRAVSVLKPDVIISSGGDYYQFSLLRMIGNEHNIPSYHYNYTTRKGTWTYAKDEASNAMNMETPWKTWKERVLTSEEEVRLDEYLTYRKKGAGEDVLSYVSNSGNEERLDEYLSYRKRGAGEDVLSYVSNSRNGVMSKGDSNVLVSLGSKPTVLLAANMVWDAAALNKEVCFENMFSWVIETIRFFEAHPEYQLIIKPHPAETHSKLRKTRQTLLGEIRSSGIRIPANVFLLEPDSSLSVYQLMQYCDLGLVYTSTVGIEMAMEGKPVVIIGRAPFRDAGFLLPPKTRSEYFDAIQKVLGGARLLEEKSVVELSRKYFYLYHYHYFIDMGFGSYKWGEIPHLTIDSFEALLPGRNAHLDFVCDSIMGGLPILSESRWPPRS